MWIKSLYVLGFGRLSHFQLDFGQGLNFLAGSNEAGKSTILNFILAMFYGLNERKLKHLEDDDRSRFMPWRGEDYGEDYGGTLDFYQNRRLYRIERRFGRTRAGDTLAVRQAVDGCAVEMGRVEPGDYFCNMSRGEFVRSFFVAQMSSEIDGDQKIQARLASVFSGGEADVSAAFLQAVLNERRLFVDSGRQSAYLRRLEKQKICLEDRLRKAIKTADARGALQSRLDVAAMALDVKQAEAHRAAHRLRIADALARRMRLDEYLRLWSETSEKKQTLQRAREDCFCQLKSFPDPEEIDESLAEVEKLMSAFAELAGARVRVDGETYRRELLAKGLQKDIDRLRDEMADLDDRREECLKRAEKLRDGMGESLHQFAEAERLQDEHNLRLEAITRRIKETEQSAACQATRERSAVSGRLASMVLLIGGMAFLLAALTLSFALPDVPLVWRTGTGGAALLLLASAALLRLTERRKQAAQARSDRRLQDQAALTLRSLKETSAVLCHQLELIERQKSEKQQNARDLDAQARDCTEQAEILAAHYREKQKTLVERLAECRRAVEDDGLNSEMAQNTALDARRKLLEAQKTELIAPGDSSLEEARERLHLCQKQRETVAERLAAIENEWREIEMTEIHLEQILHKEYGGQEGAQCGERRETDDLSAPRPRFDVAKERRRVQVWLDEQNPHEVQAVLAMSAEERNALQEGRAALDDAVIQARLELKGCEKQLEIFPDESFEMPSELEQKLAACAKAQAECARELRVIELAGALIEQADAERRAVYGPLLNETAAAYLAKLSGEKGVAMRISADFGVRLETEDQPLSRDKAYFSAGKRDQIYLALRLAMIQTLYASEAAPPIIFDDSLVQYDETRCHLALELIAGLAQAEDEPRQILFSSCHAREQALARKLGARMLVLDKAGE